MLKSFFASLLVLTTLSVSLVAQEESKLNETFKEVLVQTDALKDEAASLEDLLWNLTRKKHIAHIDNDESARPLFVNFQAVLEKSLAIGLENKTIDSVVGVIHTPTPATPLCTHGNISQGLVAPSLKNDEKRLYTVTSRADIIRELLNADAKIYVAYPSQGLEKRTKEQLQVFEGMLETYPQNLINAPLKPKELPTQLIGASYLFQMNQSIYVFSIQATQANAPFAEREWALWLGPLEDSVIADRISEVLDYVKENELTSQKNEYTAY